MLSFYLTKGQHNRIFEKVVLMMDVVKHKSSHGIYAIYNTRIKKYANGSIKFKYTSYDIPKGYHNHIKSRGNKSTDDDLVYRKYKSLYQSKQNLIDLAYHNSTKYPWEYFITLTFNDKMSTDYNIVSQKLIKWLDLIRHQNLGVRYIIVPEPHKSGRIHFHGIFANIPYLKLQEARSPRTNRKIKKNGCQIYNILNYKYGYTTCSKVKGQEQVSVYLSKYMTKNLIDLDYKKRYWSSKNLSRPDVQYAYFDKDTLKHYITNNNLDIKYETDKTLFASSDNIYYVNC